MTTHTQPPIPSFARHNTSAPIGPTEIYAPSINNRRPGRLGRAELLSARDKEVFFTVGATIISPFATAKLFLVREGSALDPDDPVAEVPIVEETDIVVFRVLGSTIAGRPLDDGDGFTGDGEFEVVIRFDYGGSFDDSPSTGLTVKCSMPGGAAKDDGSTEWINENLAAPRITPNPVPDGHGAPVTLALDPYDVAEAGDVVIFEWGGEKIAVTVMDPTQGVTGEVPWATVIKVGGGSVPVTWSVSDRVGNWSRHAPSIRADVEIDDGTLRAAELYYAVGSPVNDALDLARLDGRSFLIHLAGSAGVVAGDTVTAYWRATLRDGTTREYGFTPVRWDDPFTPIDIIVPYAYAEEAAGSHVAIWYLLNGGPRRSKTQRYSVTDMPDAELPPPIVIGREGDEIDPFVHGAFIDVVAPFNASVMVPGATVTMIVIGRLEDDGRYWDSDVEIKPGQQGEDVVFSCPAAMLRAVVNGKADFHYEIVPPAALVAIRPGGIHAATKISQTLTLAIRRKSVLLPVVGARSPKGPDYHGLPNIIVCKDGNRTPEWAYEGDTFSTPGQTFFDTRPDRPLQVRFNDAPDLVTTLRAANVCGNYNVDPAWQHGLIILDDGSVFEWGGANLNHPPFDAAVRVACASRQAFAAVLANGSLVAWGRAEEGGALPAARPGAPAGWLVASGGAFLSIASDGSAFAWGNPDKGGVIPETIRAEIVGVVAAQASEAAFTCVLASGEVLTWGGEWVNGMRVSAARGALQLAASNHAFAAIAAQGYIVTWGAEDEGGRGPGPVVASQIAATGRAFAAVTSAGTLVAWGDEEYGGKAPENARNMTSVVGSTSAFAAVDVDGRVISWGNPLEGGSAPALPPVATITALHAGFVAITRDGDVVSWGRTRVTYDGGDALAAYAAGEQVVILGTTKVVALGPDAPDLEDLYGQVTYAISHTERRDMSKHHGVQAVPRAENVHIIGETIVGGTVKGSYRYVNDAENPEGASTYEWTADGAVVGRTLELRITPALAGKLIVFTVTPVASAGEIGLPVSSDAKLVISGFQNVSDEENENSFMKQHGNYSFYRPEPSDRVYVSTGGAFSLIDSGDQNVYVHGEADWGAKVPDAIKGYLENNPATVMFSTARDFAALVPVRQTNQLLVWGTNMPVNQDLTKLRNIQHVYSNTGAFVYVYKTISSDNKWLGALGNAAGGGTIPDAIHLKLVSDPPKAVYATSTAFAVLTRAGKVYVWGDAANGGSINADAQALLNGMVVTRIVSNMSAFCAINDNGAIVPWGNAANGGVIPADRLETILDQGGVKSVIASRAAFCAITKGRAKAVSWGLASQGGDMSASAKQLAARGDIVLCKAATWAFCMVSGTGNAEAWGVANSGGTIPTGSPVLQVVPRPVDIDAVFAASTAKPAIRDLFKKLMMRSGINTFDSSAVEAAGARLAAKQDTVGPKIIIERGEISLYANDSSFCLIAQDEDKYINQLLTWGQANGGGAVPDAVRQALMASVITAVYCTNGAYAVISTQGRKEGVVTVWGATLAQMDAGEIPDKPPEIREKLSNGGITEIYSIKREPPVNPTPVRVDPSFAARHIDGSYTIWGGNVENQVFVPGKSKLRLLHHDVGLTFD